MWNSKVIFCIFIAGIVIAAFLSAFSYPFINYDTETYLLRNPRIVEPFSWMNIPWAFTTMETGDWHPLIWVSFFSIRACFGLIPKAFHSVNILLHAANALLVFLIFQYATKRKGASLMLALLFAVHPLRVESVVWVSELKDVLSGFFWWLTIGSYLRAHLDKNHNYLYWAFVFNVCGVLSKPIVVSIPLIYLLLDFWPLGRLRAQCDFPKVLFEKIPFFLLALFSAVMAITATARVENIRTLEAVPFGLRFANAVISYMTYLGKTIFPFKLAIFYPFPHEFAKCTGVVWAVFLGLLVASFGAIKMRRKCPYFLVGWFWYLITLVPVIGLLRVSDQAMADRYTYLPSIGLGVTMVWGTAEFFKRSARWLVPVVGVCVLVYFFALTKRQVSVWETPEKLNQHALDINSENYIAASNLGYIYLKKHQLDRALAYTMQSLLVHPTPVALSNGGLILTAQKKYDEAEQLFTKYLSNRISRDADIYYKFGLILLHANKRQDAEKAFLKSIKLNRGFAPSLKMLAELYLQTGQFGKAKVLVEASLAIDSNDGVSNWHKGFLAEQSGDMDEAIFHYEKAALASNRSKRALSRLIVLCSVEGDLDRIQRVSKEIIIRHPDSIQPYLVLGQLLISERKTDEAQVYLNKLLEKHPDLPDAKKLLEQMNDGSTQDSVFHPKVEPEFVVSSIDDMKILFDAVVNTTSRGVS